MDKLFAVSHVNWFDHELETTFQRGATWREAALKDENISSLFRDVETEGYPALPQTLEDAKQAAFDQDAMIEVVEVPES